LSARPRSPRFVDYPARVLHALAEAGGELPVAALEGVVHEDIRAMVIRALEDLVELGADGVLRPGPNGSLLSVRDVEARLTTRWLGRPLEIRAEVGSTNDVVLERADAGAEPGLVVVAERQCRGRGRQGRAFDSTTGLGLWSSSLLPAPAHPSLAPRLSLVAGLAVAAAVEDVAGVRPALKWPNDVRLDGRKICGILVEARTVAGRVFPVAGIGLNVHHSPDDFPPELRDGAGSVEMACGRRTERAVLLAALLARLEELVEEEAAGRLDLPARFAACDEWAGRRVRVRTADADLTGHALGVAEDGALRLDVPGQGIVRLRSGEATLAEA
jgi:BirA family biotin operon repressor/biotin-[acetyl-CoA-carboxylase] ligase